MNNPYLMIVEGRDDAHVIKNLLYRHQLTNFQVVPENVKLPLPGEFPTETVFISPQQNKDRLLANLPVFLEDGDLHTLGITIDADDNLAGTLQSIQNALMQTTQYSLRLETDPNGLILTVPRQKQPDMRVGIWLMPDNQSGGFLEHFASQMIPVSDPLWLRAMSCVAQIPQEHRLFPVIHSRKAELHTWLAWQEKPGKPMGLALTFQYLDAQAPVAQQFVNWATRLFAL